MGARRSCGQCPTLHDIDSPITFDEVDAAINKIKNGKSPGLNGIPPKPTKKWIPKSDDESMHTLLFSLKAKQNTMDGMQANASQFPNQAIFLIPINGMV